MHQRLCSTLAGWPALASLSLLLANDWWLKQHHPGWLSGKLSDFAGLALAGLLAQALWPRQDDRGVQRGGAGIPAAMPAL
ncbi:hypothetical protein [Chromobacterium violaceum]|uniref:hypothetical protein n=1 Tax=Chromobacterium violaceum TaxID=536 RepID=UPI003DA7F0CB